MKIDKHISELLHNYDCVVIPEFGGFVTNYKPADIDPNLHLFHPPSKAILFNKNLVNNDGLLANHISRLEDLDYDAANGVIRAYVRDAKSSLEAGRRVEIEKVGILYYDQEHNIQFVADGDINYLVEAFGLNSFYAPVIERTIERPKVETPTHVVTQPVVETVAPVAEQTVVEKTKATEPETVEVETRVEEQKVETVAETEEDKDNTKVIPIADTSDDDEGDDGDNKGDTGKKKRPWRYIAAAGFAVLLIGGTYGYKSITTGQRISVQTARLFDLTDWKTPIYRPHTVYDTRVEEATPDENPRAIYDQPENVYEVAVAFTDEVDKKVVVRLKERDKPVPTHVDNTFVDNPSANQFQGLKYHVIGGCFAEKSNATNFVNDMVSRGYSAHIVDHHKGLYRVAFGSFATRKEAKAKMNHIKAHEKMKSWVLKK